MTAAPLAPTPYAREIRGQLSREAFRPARSRLLWLPVDLMVIGLAAASIAKGWVPLVVAPLLSLVIGLAFASLTFLGHEALHGAVVRGQRLRHVVGWFGFLPFMVSPRLWVAWHNRVHHGAANQAGVDPDANPTLAEYRASARVRVITDRFALGRRSFTGVIGLLVGFTGQSAAVLSSAGRRGYLSPREHRLAIAESLGGLVVWGAVAALVGPVAFLFVYLLPLLVANVIVMSFIMTNHGLSPLTQAQDPLRSSLSVTTPRWIEWLTMRFGLHVEHHLFPSMSSRHAPEVRALLLARWPERYQSMPLWRALWALHTSARVYEDATTLFDPRSGRRWPTRPANVSS